MNFRPIFGGILALLFLGCQTKSTEENLAQVYVDDVRKTYAPDKRTVLFDIAASKENGNYVLRGKTNTLEGLSALRETLKENKIDFTDSVVTLPTPELTPTSNAIVNISVANLRSTPKHSAELATQATLGTPVTVLMKEGEWYYIQTPDKYLSWVDAGGITLMTNERYDEWRKTEKIIYKRTYGHIYKGPEKKDRISDVVAGSILELKDANDTFYKVQFPDGRQGFVPAEETESFQTWRDHLSPDGMYLVATAKTLMGVPYLWGGTSTKGMDCSGFTKTIYFLNGMVIPRDASQQVHTGKLMDTKENFDSLNSGDLLFFGRKATDSTAEKVVHVGMWLGNNEFIHASGQVRISSMDENSANYDAFNRNRYLRSKRILGMEDKAIIDLKESFTFHDLKP